MLGDKQDDDMRKAQQGYRTRPDTCHNCAHVRYDVKHVPGTRPYNRYELFPQHVNPHCGLGGFAVALGAVCNQHQRVQKGKPDEQAQPASP